MPPDSAELGPADDAAVHRAWQANAARWAEWMQAGASAARREVTHPALLAACQRHAPTERTLLDVGCGEAWLARALPPTWTYHGIDAQPALVSVAQTETMCVAALNFDQLSFEALRAVGLHPPADGYGVLVCNFSLLGEHDSRHLVEAAPALLQPDGKLIIQTLHPDGQEGWRWEEWRAFSSAWPAPSPWFARSLEGWQELLCGPGLTLHEVSTPKDAEGTPLSLLLVAGP